MTHADELDAWLDRAVTNHLSMMVVRDLIRTCRGLDDAGVRLAVARHEILAAAEGVLAVQVVGVLQ
jgi:hypothetical protein